MSSSSDVAAGRVVKHSLVIAGHRTSISLEDLFWRTLRDLAVRRGLSLAALVREVDSTRGAANLSSALRVAVLRDALSRGTVEPALATGKMNPGT